MPDKRDERLESLIAKYTEIFHARNLNCAEVVLTIMTEYYGIDLDCCPRIATAFGGGLSGRQMFCGAISGGLMVIGLKAGREQGGDKMPAYMLGQRLIDWAQADLGSTQCREITGFDISDPAQQAVFNGPGGAHETVCEPFAGRVCRFLVELLNE